MLMMFHKNISWLVLNDFFQDQITSTINLEKKWKFELLIYWSYAEKPDLWLFRESSQTLPTAKR